MQKNRELSFDLHTDHMGLVTENEASARKSHRSLETTPEHLDELVKKALVSVNEGLETEAVAWKYLQHGRPNPTYRFDAVVNPE